MSYLYLTVAIVAEVVATSFLKLSDGFTRPLPTLIVAGKYRVIGCEKYNGALASPARDNGQGATGTAGTTVAVEADDVVETPFYEGPIVTEDGTINEGA